MPRKLENCLVWGRNTHIFGIRGVVSRHTACLPAALGPKDRVAVGGEQGSQNRTVNKVGAEVIPADCKCAGSPNPLMSQESLFKMVIF